MPKENATRSSKGSQEPDRHSWGVLGENTGRRQRVGRENPERDACPGHKRSPTPEKSGLSSGGVWVETSGVSARSVEVPVTFFRPTPHLCDGSRPDSAFIASAIVVIVGGECKPEPRFLSGVGCKLDLPDAPSTPDLPYYYLLTSVPPPSKTVTEVVKTPGTMEI